MNVTSYYSNDLNIYLLTQNAKLRDTVDWKVVSVLVLSVCRQFLYTVIVVLLCIAT